jgi:predicted transcriptional regulator
MIIMNRKNKSSISRCLKKMSMYGLIQVRTVKEEYQEGQFQYAKVYWYENDT